MKKKERLVVVERPKSHRVYSVAGFFAVALVGFAVGYFLRSPEIVSTKAIRENTDQYKFVSPLLAVTRSDSSVPSPEYASLEKKVSSYISSREKTGQLDTASVYFINYSKGGSFALNINEPYAPASLMKVAIMIAYLKQSESDPSVLSRQLVYTKAMSDSLAAAAYDTGSELTACNSYPVQTLINDMIIDSDNGAMNLLLANIGDSFMNEMYKELGVQGPQDNIAYTISANDYSLFFRILYNATYLSADDSEKALSILSQATYKDGLVAGLPAGTTVAHKFGEKVNNTGDTIDGFELHDCGIVYQKNNNYLLCVMTKGKVLTDLSDTISSIAKTISASL